MADIISLYSDADYYTVSYVADYFTSKIHHLDLTNKLIYLNLGVVTYHPVEDIYKEVRFIRQQDESLRVMPNPVSAGGNIAKGGGKYTPRYAILNHGWRIVPANENHSLYITGEQITDDGQSGPACLNTSVLSLDTRVIIHYEPPTSELLQVEVVTEVDLSQFLTVPKFLALK